jgi:hypothetical protein
MNFRLAKNNEQDAKNFCALSNSLYARPVNKAYYRWQFFACPFPSLLNIAVDEKDNLVGSYCLHVQGKVAWVLDIMVSQQIQRQGVFRKLVDFGFENLKEHNLDAIVVMANEKADRACVNGLGWKRINTFLTCFAKPDELHNKTKYIPEFEKVENFSSCDSIIKNACQKNLFANTRSVEYLNWRFMENPRYAYDVFVAHKNGLPFGYAVLKIFRDPVTNQAFGDIVDILWIEDDKEALADMLRFSLAHFHNRNVGSVAMWLQTNTVLDEIGLEIGFRQSEQKRFFCGVALKENFKCLEDAGSWFINMSDSEVY